MRVQIISDHHQEYGKGMKRGEGKPLTNSKYKACQERRRKEIVEEKDGKSRHIEYH